MVSCIAPKPTKGDGEGSVDPASAYDDDDDDELMPDLADFICMLLCGVFCPTL